MLWDFKVMLKPEVSDFEILTFSFKIIYLSENMPQPVFF